MQFSVLLPTHDRLEYLRFAVQSVLRQDCPDWEIVISDNDSSEDVAGYARSVGDSRIRYVRTAGFVPVTVNWNNALRHSSGDYVVMLGDDDALLPGYLSGLRDVIESFGGPDAVYTGAYLFAYPGVLPDLPEGYLQPNLHGPFFAGHERPFILPVTQARELARAAASFRALYDFNMQYVLLSRHTIQTLAGDGEFFRSPYPDYYAMNLLFARAERIVVDPQPRVVIGITRRSYGFFHFNGKSADARALLNTEDVDPAIRQDLASVVLPGADMNTSWLLAVESLYRRLGSPAEMRPDYSRYRHLQALHCMRAYYVDRSMAREQVRLAQATLPPVQRLLVRSLGPLTGALLRHVPDRVRQAYGALVDRLVGQYGHVVTPTRELGRYATVLAVLDHFEPTVDPAARA